MRAQQVLLAGLGSLAPQPQQQTPVASRPPGEVSWVAPVGFPTNVWPSYYYLPAQPTQEPQPIIHDPILHKTFPYSLTDPDNIPQENDDPLVFPKPRKHISKKRKHALINQVKDEVASIIEKPGTDTCSTCKAALAAARPAAWYAPKMVPDAIVELCQDFEFKSDKKCNKKFSAETDGAIWTQVLALADVEGQDGDYICHEIGSWCDEPSTNPLDTSSLFPKPKPENAQAPAASGERVKVLHLSDFHLDARYAVGSEANCSKKMCCRTNKYNKSSKNEVLLPASAYGAYSCDTPYDLALAALQAIGPLTGTGEERGSFAFSLYTGDSVSHDKPTTQLSRDYLEYAETSVSDMLKAFISGPVFATLGNHDSVPENIDAPHKFPGKLGRQQSWNHRHISSLWQHEGWIDRHTAEEASTHYGGYSVKTQYGLRIIAINTDFWITSNNLNFVNTTNPDMSGTFSWMISELQAAEDKKERVWIIGHVPSGWDGNNAFSNPTNLFYQIIDRYSPHVIANTFWGHMHEEMFHLYYANNGTVQNSDTALMTGWIGPSITPLHNLNSAFRMYEIDTSNFEVYDSYTFFSNVSDFSALSETGPIFRLEYSARDTYGPAINWDQDAPLNATFWHRVTEAMEDDITLVAVQNDLQGRLSVNSPKCVTEECQKAKICYMRSGSTALGRECIPGYGSVQSDFKA